LANSRPFPDRRISLINSLAAKNEKIRARLPYRNSLELAGRDKNELIIIFKENIPVTLYPEHLERLFVEN
jgi:hypothetical protein